MLALFTMASIGSAQHLSAGLLDVLGLRSACTWLGLCDETTPSGAEKPTVKRKSPKAKPAHPSAGQGGFTIPSQQGAPAAETIDPKAESKAKEATPTISRPLPPVNPSHTVSLPETPSFEELCAGGNEFACGILRRNQDQGDWRVPGAFAPSGMPTMPGASFPAAPRGPTLNLFDWPPRVLQQFDSSFPQVLPRVHAPDSASRPSQTFFNIPSAGFTVPVVNPFNGTVPVSGSTDSAVHGQPGQGNTDQPRGQTGGQGDQGNQGNQGNQGSDCDDECNCSDGVDNDNNGLTDNDDLMCQSGVYQAATEDCYDGIDNDENGLTDGDDLPACEGAYDYEDYEDSPNFNSTGDSTSIYYYDFQ